jgi:hypothetical protein
MLKHSIKVFCLLLTLLGSSCSLQDHNIPEPDNPDPETPVTNEFKVSTTGIKLEGDKLYLQGNVDQVDFTHQIDPNDNEEKAVVGFLVSSRVTNNNPINSDPHYDGDPSVRFYFVKDFVDYPSGYLETGSVSTVEPFAFTEIYFRTVLLLKNKVIYGNVFHQSGFSLPAKPLTWELNTNSYVADESLNVSITKQGQIPAEEVGFVVSYKEKDSDKIKDTPTILDKRLVINWKNGDKGSYLKKGGYSQKVNFNYKELYFRPYLILQNGNVVYGNVVHVKK